ncbi:hypothetical protein D3C78_1015590 [compost metagenome]
MVKILAELAFGDQAFEMVGGRGNDAHIHLHPLAAADTLELLVDQHAQDLVLRFARHFADFVEIKHSAMGLFERTHLAWLPGQAFRAKQRNFHAVGRDRRGIERHERSCSARGFLVHHARHQLLAGTGGAEDHDAAVGGGHPVNGLAKLRHGK